MSDFSTPPWEAKETRCIECGEIITDDYCNECGTEQPDDELSDYEWLKDEL